MIGAGGASVVSTIAVVGVVGVLVGALGACDVGAPAEPSPSPSVAIGDGGGLDGADDMDAATAHGGADVDADSGGARGRADTTPPRFRGISGVATMENAALLSWDAATDDVSDASSIVYLVFVATAPGGEDFTAPSFVTSPGATSVTIAHLAASTSYAFVVRARDGAGNVDANDVELTARTPDGDDVVPPSFAGVASAQAVSDSAIALAWSAGSDAVTPQTDLVYAVYRGGAAGHEDFGAPAYVTAPGATSFTATGLAPASTYAFVVRARDAQGNEDQNGVEVVASTLADRVAPSFAGAEAATSIGASAIELTWAPAADDVTAASAITYAAYVASSAGGESFASATATSSPGASSIVVDGVPTGAPVYAIVHARDAAGNEDANRNEVRIVTRAYTLSGDVQPIFTATCATDACHVGPDPEMDLDLSTAARSYAGLVSVASERCGGAPRVAPGDPDGSYVVAKLVGRGACFFGDRMPYQATPLDAAALGAIRSWIAGGARND